MIQIALSKTSLYTFRLLEAVLILLLLSAGSLFWFSHSPTANKWLLETLNQEVDDIHIGQIQGSLANGLEFDFQYQDETVTVALAHTRLQIRPGCFLRLEVCVSSITLDRLTITVNDTADTATDASTANEPIELPGIVIPVPVNVDLVQVGALAILQGDDNLYQASAIQFSASAIHRRVNANHVQAQDEFCGWKANGTIRLTRRYPLQVNAICTTSLYPVNQIKAIAKGDLDHLELSASTQGDLNSRVDLALEPLADNLPLHFKVRLTEPFHYVEEDNTLVTVADANVSGTGNLDALQLNSRATLNSELFPSPLKVMGRSTLHWDHLTIASLALTLPQGEIQNKGELRFSPTLQWHVESELHHVSLQQFEPSVQGDISGSILHSGNLQEDNQKEDNLHIEADLNQLSGLLFGTPWNMDGQVALENNIIQLRKLSIEQERNHASANGHIALEGVSDLQLKLDIKQFDLVMPDLDGALTADLKLTGTIEQPKVVGTLSARALAYEDIRLASAQGFFDMEPLSQRASQLNLRFDQLQLSDQLQLNGLATVEGNVDQHLTSIRLREQAGNSISLQCRGQFPQLNGQSDFNQWLARCHRSRIKVAALEPPQTWQLKQPFTLTLKDREQATLSPLCYQNNGSTLCLKNAITASAASITPLQLSGSQLDLRWLQQWLPAGLLTTGQVDISSTVELLPELDVEAQALTRNAQVTISDQSQHSINLNLQTAILSARLSSLNQQQRVSLQWQVESDAGSSQATLALIDDRLSGDASIENFNLAPFSRWLLQEEGDHINGIASGTLQLSGTLAAPEFAGRAQLKQGEIHMAMLPMPISDITIELNAEDREAALNGTFMAGDKPGTLTGTFNWQQEDWWSKATFQSDTLAYQPQDNILLYLKPNITFDITPETLAISGNVHIPKARIHLKTLPEQAVSTSPDVEIIGDDAAGSSTLKISSNIDLSLGDDVRFKGYGLETDVTGQMSISQHQSDLMQSKGIIRLKNGTYQAYGQSLTITDGDLIFIDALDNPQLRFSATRNNISDNVVVGIRVTGRARNPDIVIFSIPEMPQQEKFYYLITGRAPNTDATQDSSSVAAEAAVAMALESRGGSLTRKAGETFGIQDLTLSTGSTENRSEVGLSGYITPDLMVRYGVGMFEAVNTLTLKYRIKKNLYAEVISGKSNAFDLLWSFDRN